MALLPRWAQTQGTNPEAATFALRRMEARVMAHLFSRRPRPHRARFGFTILTAVVLLATTGYGLALNGQLPV